MKLLIVSILLLFSILSTAKTLRIAIIDTGLKSGTNLPVCPTDNKTFFGDDFTDEHGHGSLVTEIINQQATKNSKIDYCFVIIKTYGYVGFDNKNLNNRFEEALKYVSTLKVDFVNISGGGYGFNQFEYRSVKQILDNGAIVIAAAGNEVMNLDQNCNYFPACYDKRIIIVGSNDSPSNYGKVVTVKAPGKVLLTSGATIVGSSFATAFITGNLVRVKAKHRIPNIDPKHPYQTGVITPEEIEKAKKKKTKQK